MMPLTAKQKKCFNAIRAEISAGNLPTLRRIADRLGVKSISTVQRYLTHLEKRGAIERIPGSFGAIRLKELRRGRKWPNAIARTKTRISAREKMILGLRAALT
jgi:SOS-response transcriptional repressor LexA